MVKEWKIIYYEDEKGFSEVYDYIEKQKSSNKAKIMSWLSVLEEKGPLLPRPYADLLRNGIHELRIKLSGDQVRILYFFCFEEFIVLSNHFKKKTDKVPDKEIKKAEKIKTSFTKRYNYEKLKGEYNEDL